MRTIAVVLLLSALAFGQVWGGRGGYSPLVSTETDIQYFTDGLIYDLYEDIVFTIAFTESINGADSCAFGIDFNSVTYDFFELWVFASMTADYVAGDEQAGAVIQCYPYFDMTAFTGYLTPSSMGLNHTAVTTAGRLYSVVSCSDSTSGAREFIIGYLLPGETKVWGPFHINASVLTDSLVTGFEAITTDSTEFTWSIVAIPRT